MKIITHDDVVASRDKAYLLVAFAVMLTILLF